MFEEVTCSIQLVMSSLPLVWNMRTLIFKPGLLHWNKVVCILKSMKHFEDLIFTFIMSVPFYIEIIDTFVNLWKVYISCSNSSKNVHAAVKELFNVALNNSIQFKNISEDFILNKHISNSSREIPVQLCLFCHTYLYCSFCFCEFRIIIKVIECFKVHFSLKVIGIKSKSRYELYYRFA